MIYYVVEFEARHCEAEVYVNAVPVVRASQREPYHGRPVNHMLVPGRNSLAFAACLGPSPSSAWAPRGPIEITGGIPNAHAKLWRIPPGGFPGEPGSELVCEIDWKPDPDSVRSITAAVPRIVSFDMPATYPAPLWTGCEPLTPDSAAQTAAVLGTLHQSLAEYDAEPFIRLARPRFEDCAGAFGVNLEQDMADFRGQLAEHSSSIFEPFDPAALDPRIVGGGRMVDCLDSSWRSPLRTKPDATGAVKLSYRVRLGRLKGLWRIVL